MNYNDMAYVQLLKTISDTVNSNADDTYQNANTLIQLFNAPYDKVTLGSTVITSLNADPANNIVWAGSGASNWTWGSGGTYDPFYGTTHGVSDTLTLSATATVTSAFVADLNWGSASVTPVWSWNMGAIYQ